MICLVMRNTTGGKKIRLVTQCIAYKVNRFSTLYRNQIQILNLNLRNGKEIMLV